MSQNTFCWADVPVTNLDRAIRFYSAVLGSPVKKESAPGMEFGLLPHFESNVSGCLVDGKMTENQPSQNARWSISASKDASTTPSRKSGNKAGRSCKKSSKSARTASARSSSIAKGTASHCTRRRYKDDHGFSHFTNQSMAADWESGFTRWPVFGWMRMRK